MEELNNNDPIPPFLIDDINKIETTYNKKINAINCELERRETLEAELEFNHKINVILKEMERREIYDIEASFAKSIANLEIAIYNKS
jgi:hypothetical protein